MYCQPDDLTTLLPKVRLLELADDSRDLSGQWTDEAVRAVLTQECAGAAGEIDSLIGQRYAVPLSPIPPVVADWAKRLTVARLFLRRPDLEGEGPDRWRKEGERILKLLEKAGSGLVSLGAQELDTQTKPDDGSLGLVTGRQKFGGDTWRRY